MALMTGPKGDFFRTLLSLQPFKPGQGSLARNVTIAAMAVLVLGGAYSFSVMQREDEPVLKWIVPIVFGAIAMWIGYRMVHFPRFADFLISTEAEMNKVSWPSWGEVKASTVVVLVLSVLMAAFLFLADSFWKWLLAMLGILKIGGIIGGGGSSLFHIPPLPTLELWLPFLF